MEEKGEIVAEKRGRGRGGSPERVLLQRRLATEKSVKRKERKKKGRISSRPSRAGLIVEQKKKGSTDIAILIIPPPLFL